MTSPFTRKSIVPPRTNNTKNIVCGRVRKGEADNHEEQMIDYAAYGSVLRSAGTPIGLWTAKKMEFKNLKVSVDKKNQIENFTFLKLTKFFSFLNATNDAKIFCFILTVFTQGESN